jgi:type VI secretion system protein ImpJ
MAALSDKNFPIPFNINWHEGMLLSQHHFQQNDLRYEQILAHQIKLLSSIHFGVCHLRIDNVALPNGIYRINEIEAIFPDGLILSYFPDDTNKLKPIEVNVKSLMKRDQNEATVYLSILKSNSDSSPLLSNPPRFYSLDVGYTKDDNILDNEVKIPRLFPNAFLSIDEIPNSCIGFPLCKIIKIEGVYHIKNWTPPCFFIAKHFPMWERCRKLALSLREKVTFLSEKLKNQTGSLNAITGTEQILKQLLMVLPSFEALIYSDQIRPYDLYQELSRTLGIVSVLIPMDIAPIMRPYNHENIDFSIYPLIDMIDHYISIVERGFTTITMDKKERFFYHYITQDDLEACTDGKIYIGVRAELNSDVLSWMDNAIIVSDVAIENVREKRVKGAKRSISSNDMFCKIMPGFGVLLFEITLDNTFIKGEQNLHIFNPGDSATNRPLEITVYIPKEKSRIKNAA